MKISLSSISSLEWRFSRILVPIREFYNYWILSMDPSWNPLFSAERSYSVRVWGIPRGRHPGCPGTWSTQKILMRVGQSCSEFLMDLMANVWQDKWQSKADGAKLEVYSLACATPKRILLSTSRFQRKLIPSNSWRGVSVIEFWMEIRGISRENLPSQRNLLRLRDEMMQPKWDLFLCEEKVAKLVTHISSLTERTYFMNSVRLRRTIDGWWCFASKNMTMFFHRLFNLLKSVWDKSRLTNNNGCATSAKELPCSE